MPKTTVGFFLCAFLTAGCSHYTAVDYREVNPTNRVVIEQDTGARIEGTVVRAEPHEIVLIDKNQQTVAVSKSVVRKIKRKPPMVDEFGNGISEEEVEQRLTKRSTTLYGIGGGMLSFGISFFAGSLIGNATNRGGQILAVSTVVGTAIGTVWFLQAGKNKDLQTAIQSVKAERRTAEIIPPNGKAPETDLQQRLENERKKQEELRKEREALLKQLNQPSNAP
ncbi:MAG TPA: hypothetical protein VGB38_08385 [bacterium]